MAENMYLETGLPDVATNKERPPWIPYFPAGAVSGVRCGNLEYQLYPLTDCHLTSPHLSSPLLTVFVLLIFTVGLAGPDLNVAIAELGVLLSIMTQLTD